MRVSWALPLLLASSLISGLFGLQYLWHGNGAFNAVPPRPRWERSCACNLAVPPSDAPSPILVGTVLTTDTALNENMADKSRHLEAHLPAIVANRQEYAERHGYALQLSRVSEDMTRPTSWGRIRFIRRMLYQYEWVFYMDADVLVTNMSVALESFLDRKYDIIMCLDFGGNVQAGNILARDTRWTRSFLDEVYSYTQFILDEWVEQRAIIEYLNKHPDWKEHIKVLPQRAFNSFPVERFYNVSQAAWHPGDFLVHFAGGADLQVEVPTYLSRVVR
jgi:hypothetical protein